MLAQGTDRIESAQAVLPFSASLRIGDLAVALNGASMAHIHVSGQLANFRAAGGDRDIDVDVECADNLQLWRGEKVFDSGGLWTLFRDGTDFVFDFVSPVFGVCPYKRMLTDRDFRSVQLILNRQAFPGHPTVYPLEYPADELVITNFLAAHGLGVEVHGCGLIDAETGGHLFLGHSGAGKSTTTRLWKSVRNPQILSDDRIILRLHRGELWMYGTPWHGEAAFASPGKAKLSRIFILQHGSQNEKRRLTKAQAVGEVFARSFPPFHSASGLESTLEFIHRVLDVVPCYEFQFVPDEGAVKAALAFND